MITYVFVFFSSRTGLRVTPSSFGGDPTGRKDSWPALNAALNHCLNQSALSPNGYFPGEDSTPSFGNNNEEYLMYIMCIECASGFFTSFWVIFSSPVCIQLLATLNALPHSMCPSLPPHFFFLTTSYYYSFPPRNSILFQGPIRDMGGCDIDLEGGE